jgi:sugar phosphate isomerase/epimerase
VSEGEQAVTSSSRIGLSHIGLSTYSFFWQWHETAPRPLSLTDLVIKTAGWDVELLQLCDHPAVDRLGADAAADLLATGRHLGVAYELGTRGLDTAHLLHYLDLAGRLDVSLVRSMVRREEIPDAANLLAKVVPAYAEAGVTLALETYEQIPTRTLVELVREVDDAYLGIVLDPGNSVAALETPRSTIDLTAELTRNLHVKDFAFSRQAGWVGFTYAGMRLGEGLLDYDYLVSQVRPHERGINQIVEHWLVWQGDSETTCRLEDDWTLHNLDYLRQKAAAHTHHEGALQS